MNSPQLLTQLNRRYATKHFDTTKKISPEQLHTLEEVLRLSPSSFGLQGWGFVVVENPELRQQLLPYAWNQAQVIEASHLIVLCRRTDVDTDFVQHYFDTMATARNQELSQLDGYKNVILGFLEGKDDITIAQWLTKQVYIAQGFLLSACAMLEIDACPMEGFDTHKFDEILGLAELNLTSSVMTPIGFRSAEDTYAHAPKVRFPADEVIFRK